MPKKALLIISHQNFRDEEYTEPKAALEKAGIQTTTASSSRGLKLLPTLPLTKSTRLITTQFYLSAGPVAPNILMTQPPTRLRKL
jgi:putative intracellular protease/amidase